MAIEAGDFRTGLTLIVDGDPWVVLDFQHVKPGKGAAILKTKMKNLKTGSTQERNFNANTKFEQAVVERKTAQYSYESDNTYYFLVDSMEVTLNFFDGLLLDISVPDKVELVVAETTPGVKGAPTTQTKDAVTNTGLTLRVPQFIEEGETILVTSADGKYSSRA